jgi:N6-L-threonylcarbamoyladenine synthase
MGSLLVGISAAKAVSLALEIPLIGVNHVHAHLFAGMMAHPDLSFPFIGLIVSGGHTAVYLAHNYDDFSLMGQTIDDAAGEAYDKVAKILGLGYPGGPILDRMAGFGDTNRVSFPRSYMGRDSLDFSFSGIKTAVLYFVRDLRKSGRITKKDVKDIAACFQDSVSDVLVKKAVRACRIKNIGKLVIGGGVSANSALRSKIGQACNREGIDYYMPPIEYCLDNAAMVAGLGQKLFQGGKSSDLEMSARLN